MTFWAPFWTVVWFGGLVTFAALSVMVAVFGLRDLVHLFRTLMARHAQAGEAAPVEPDLLDSPEKPGPPGITPKEPLT